MSGLWIKIILFLLPLLSWLSSCSTAEESEKCRIYVDLASTPALLQMVDAIKAPKEEYKLLILKRFHSQSSSTLQDRNIQMVGGFELGNRDYDEFAQIIDENVIDFYLKHPKAQYELHLNINHLDYHSGHIFDIIPHKQIKSIHLYEDAVGRMLWDQDVFIYLFSVSKIAPIYLHMRYINQFENANIIQYDFNQQASELTDVQKDMLVQMNDLDRLKLKEMFAQRPVAIFLDDNALMKEEAEIFLKKLSEKYDIKKFHWIYKNHPRKSLVSEAYEVLVKYVGQVEILPNKMPVEVLSLLGLKLDYVAGYGSSGFFSFDEKQVIGYIKRKYFEDYLPLLKEFKIVNQDDILDIGWDVPSYD